ncbi:MAG: hypothetical protein WC736_09945 [Gallionella sp.]|jgi:hypothetical protein
MRKQTMIWKWVLTITLLLPLGGCSYVSYAYIEISLIDKSYALSELSVLNKKIANWTELEFQSDCVEDFHFMKKFRQIKDNSVYVSSVLNAENGTLALAFSQVGETKFTPDAENLFIKLTDRLKEVFGEDRVIVRRDSNSGKEALEDSLKGDPKRLFFCNQTK